jgi:hypothetical protein
LPRWFGDLRRRGSIITMRPLETSIEAGALDLNFPRVDFRFRAGIFPLFLRPKKRLGIRRSRLTEGLRKLALTR